MVDRVYENNAIQSPPVAPAVPSVGYPTAGNPAQGIPATRPGSYWYYMVTEALRQSVIDADLVPDHLVLGQLSKAIHQRVDPVTLTAYRSVLVSGVAALEEV